MLVLPSVPITQKRTPTTTTGRKTIARSRFHETSTHLARSPHTAHTFVVTAHVASVRAIDTGDFGNSLTVNESAYPIILARVFRESNDTVHIPFLEFPATCTIACNPGPERYPVLVQVSLQLATYFVALSLRYQNGYHYDRKASSDTREVATHFFHFILLSDNEPVCHFWHTGSNGAFD